MYQIYTYTHIYYTCTHTCKTGYVLTPVEFDKDIDAQMMLVTSASNLRARCYKIPSADMHQSRLIAGKVS